MQQVSLGGTGLMVSRLGLGTDTYHAGGITLPHITEIALRAWELGINFIDTDRSYDVLPALAAALPHMDRSRLVLATKTYEKTRDGALRDVELALEALRTDYIDLFLLHGVDSLAEYEAFAGALEGLHEARARGWIAHIGLSTHAVQVVEAMAHQPAIEAVLAVLNLAGKNIRRAGGSERSARAMVGGWARRIGLPGGAMRAARAVADGAVVRAIRGLVVPVRQGEGNAGLREEMEGAVRRLYEAGQGVYIMKPFARGRLFDDANRDRPLTPDQVRRALAYLYRLPFVHSVVPGMRSVQQVEQNVTIVEDLLAER